MSDLREFLDSKTQDKIRNLVMIFTIHFFNFSKMDHTILKKKESVKARH